MEDQFMVRMVSEHQTALIKGSNEKQEDANDQDLYFTLVENLPFMGKGYLEDGNEMTGKGLWH